MPAIKATNSKDILVENCSFYGFDTDIELENVEGFISKNNQFSQDNNPKLLLNKLSQEISNSRLDKSSKERLAKQIIKALSSRGALQREESKIKNTLQFVGNQAVSFFIQLASAVMTGLVMKQLSS